MTDTITLTLRQTATRRIVADVVAPDRFASLSNRDIGALPMWVAASHRDGPSGEAGTVPLGEMFDIQGDRAAALRIVGGLGVVDGLGAGMVGGSLVIDGDAGCEVGRLMRGGTITVSGSAGADVGVAMGGGSITIAGNVGDRVGGPLPGGSRGMTGGEILVCGNAGRDAAVAVRRGLVVVGGDAADAGRALIAGTVVVMGTIRGPAGQWNKRGSIITIGGATVPPTYRFACTYQPPYLAVLGRYLQSRGFPVDTRLGTGRFARHCGDMSQLGRGELLIWAGGDDAER